MEIQSVLPGTILREMVEAARAAAAHAHAPYSHFQVGASVLDEIGRIFSGCNIENASYGLTICAERNAVGTAICAGALHLQAIVVYTVTPALTPPCGACRQVLSEFGRLMEVHLYNHEGVHVLHRLDQLLPLAFTL